MGNIIQTSNAISVSGGNFSPNNNLVMPASNTSTFNGVSYFNNAVTLSGNLNLSNASSIQLTGGASSIGPLNNSQLNTLATLANSVSGVNFTGGAISAQNGVTVGSNTVIDGLSNIYINSGGYVYYFNGTNKVPVLDSNGNVLATSLKVNGNTVVDSSGNVNLGSGTLTSGVGKVPVIDQSGNINIQPNAKIGTSAGTVLDASGNVTIQGVIQNVSGNKIVDSNGNIYFAAGNSTIGGLTSNQIINLQGILAGTTSVTAPILTATTSVNAPLVTGTTLSGTIINGSTYQQNGSTILDATGNLTVSGNISGTTLSGSTVNGGSYQVGGTQVIDPSGNLTNVKSLTLTNSGNILGAGQVSAGSFRGGLVNGSSYQINGNQLVDTNGNITAPGSVSGTTVFAPTLSGTTVNINTLNQGGNVLIDASGNITSPLTVKASTINGTTKVTGNLADFPTYNLNGNTIIDSNANIKTTGTISGTTLSGSTVQGTLISGSTVNGNVFQSNGITFMDANGNLSSKGTTTSAGNIYATSGVISSNKGFSVGGTSSSPLSIDQSGNLLLPTGTKLYYGSSSSTPAIDSSGNFYLNGVGSLYGSGGTAIVDTVGNLNGTSLKIGGTQIIDSVGNVTLNSNLKNASGQAIIDSSGNRYTPSGTKVIDSSGNIYYTSGNKLIDTLGNLYSGVSNTVPVIDNAGNVNATSIKQAGSTILDASGNFYSSGSIGNASNLNISSITASTSGTLNGGLTTGLGITHQLSPTNITPTPSGGFYYYLSMTFASQTNAFVSPVMLWSSASTVMTTFINMKNQAVTSGSSFKIQLYWSASGGTTYTLATSFTLSNTVVVQYFGVNSTYSQNFYTGNLNSSQVSIGSSSNNWTLKENSSGSLCFYNSLAGLNGTAPVACISASGNLVAGTS